MTDPRKPDGSEEPGISLPPWVDDAIAKSRDRVPSESKDVGDVGPAAELSVAPPGPPENVVQEERTALPGADPDAPEHVEVGSPMDARRRAVMPWVALALIFLAAALVLGYILLTTPKSQ